VRTSDWIGVAALGAALAMASSLALAAPPPAPAPASAPGKSVAITFDDLPVVTEGFSLAEAQAETDRLLSVLRRHHVRTIGFVNEDKLEVNGEVAGRTQLLERWLDAGMDLGDHGYAHINFQTTPLADYEANALKGERVTRRLLAARGRAPKYYRFPVNQTGPTPEIRDAFQAFLRAHGYSVAPMTFDDDDFVFAAVYADDIRKGDDAEATRVRDAYLAHLDDSIDAGEAMSQSLFGRQIPQVFLIHANRLNADTLDATLGAFEKRGYRFLTLSEALKDPAYRSPDGYAGPYGMSWFHRWAIGLGRKIKPMGQPDPEPWIEKRYAEVTAPPPAAAK
jgi:peptidoglycan/xylan/chitin deacetylase (PgdA/CDA1 family)